MRVDGLSRQCLWLQEATGKWETAVSSREECEEQRGWKPPVRGPHPTPGPSSFRSYIAHRPAPTSRLPPAEIGRRMDIQEWLRGAVDRRQEPDQIAPVLGVGQHVRMTGPPGAPVRHVVEDGRERHRGAAVQVWRAREDRDQRRDVEAGISPRRHGRRRASSSQVGVGRRPTRSRDMLPERYHGRVVTQPRDHLLPRRPGVRPTAAQ